MEQDTWLNFELTDWDSQVAEAPEKSVRSLVRLPKHTDAPVFS